MAATPPHHPIRVFAHKLRSVRLPCNRMVPLAAGLAAWSLVATMALSVQGTMLEGTTAEVEQLRRGEEERLLDRLREVRRRLGVVADLLERAGDMAAGQPRVVTRLAAVSEGLRALERRLTEAERKPVPRVDRQRLADLRAVVETAEAAQYRASLRFASLANGAISQMESTILSTGLEVWRPAPGGAQPGAADLMAGPVLPPPRRGLGGPFVPAGSTGSGEGIGLSLLNRQIDRWDEVTRLWRALPGVPLQGYTVNSTYGLRRDPMNGGWAQHSGIDLGAPMRAPVAAAAHGIVTLAGWEGAYGRIVELDHGMGIRTRYAHLDSISVQPGQRVRRGQLIGRVGLSGRSTGSHLHYEIMVNGEMRDPEPFLRASGGILPTREQG